MRGLLIGAGFGLGLAILVVQLLILDQLGDMAHSVKRLHEIAYMFWLNR